MQSINQSIISLHSKVYEESNRLTLYRANRGWRRRSGLLVKKLPNISNGTWATHLRRGRILNDDIIKLLVGVLVKEFLKLDSNQHSTIRHNTLYLRVPAQKLMNSQLNLPHAANQKKSKEESKNKKKQDTQKKWSSHEVHGISPEVGRESMVGRSVKEVALELGVKKSWAAFTMATFLSHPIARRDHYRVIWRQRFDGGSITLGTARRVSCVQLPTTILAVLNETSNKLLPVIIRQRDMSQKSRPKLDKYLDSVQYDIIQYDKLYLHVFKSRRKPTQSTTWDKNLKKNRNIRKRH